MFDVIVDEARKYSPKARKFTTKAGKFIESLDTIARRQIMTERLQVMFAADPNVQRSVHVKPSSKQGRPRAEHVKLSAELLSSSRKLPSLREKLPSFH